MKKTLKWLPLIAVLFAAGTFVAMEPARIGSLEFDWLLLTVSLLVLYLVFWMRAVVWWLYLRQAGLAVSLRDALTSRFITILTKYLPGKIWPLLTAAGYLGEENKYNARLLYVSWYQGLIVLSGIFVGSSGLIALFGWPAYYHPLTVILMLVTGGLMEMKIVFRKIIQPLTGRLGIETPFLNRHSGLFLLVNAGSWFLLSLAYWLMFHSAALDLSLPVTMAQALANVAGILFPLAPGGLGIREAAGAAYLAATELTLAEAVIYATLARAWFFAAELLVFITGILTALRTHHAVRQP